MKISIRTLGTGHEIANTIKHDQMTGSRIESNSVP